MNKFLMSSYSEKFFSFGFNSLTKQFRLGNIQIKNISNPLKLYLFLIDKYNQNNMIKESFLQ